MREGLRIFVKTAEMPSLKKSLENIRFPSGGAETAAGAASVASFRNFREASSRRHEASTKGPRRGSESEQAASPSRAGVSARPQTSFPRSAWECRLRRSASVLLTVAGTESVRA